MVKKIEYTLWIAGISCLLIWGYANTQTVLAQTNAIKNIESLISDTESVEPDQSLWSEHRIREYQAVQSTAATENALAILEIPGLDLKAAIFNGTSNRILNLGIGRIPGTAWIGEPGNLGLAGHRDGLFRPLKDISIGDSIEILHAMGVDTYMVADLLIVDPEDVSVLAPTETPSLTLVTCYPFYFVGSAPKRYIVVAEKQTI